LFENSEEKRPLGRPVRNLEENIKGYHGTGFLICLISIRKRKEYDQNAFNLCPEYLQILYPESCWTQGRKKQGWNDRVFRTGFGTGRQA